MTLHRQHLFPAVFFLVFIVLVSDVPWIKAADLSNCQKGLGMEFGQIPDNAISASSSYDEASVGPANARIRQDVNGGAWCPKQQITKNVYEWIQIDLPELKVITQVETQGRFGNGQGQEYAEYYMLEYQRVPGGPWFNFTNRKYERIIEGNSNTYIAQPREIVPPIIARRVRIVPYSELPRTVCMRVELYGCPWRDGVLSYSMPQGEKRGPEVDLIDATYDGQITDDYLYGGLGQLTDGVEGHSNFRLDPDNWGRKGYEWVGWRNDTTSRPPIEIIFEFDRVRNFSAIRFHCNNMFSKEVQVFKRALIYFSLSGKVYSSEPIIYDYTPDTLIEFARNIIVSVPHRIARFIKVKLFFQARWLMISEVRFESVVAKSNFTDEHVMLPSFIHNASATGTTYVTEDSSKVVEPADDQLIGIVIGVLGVLMVFLVAIVIFCVIFRRRNKYTQNGKLGGPQQVMLNIRGMTQADILTVNGLNKKPNNPGIYSNVISYDAETLYRKQQNGLLPAPLLGNSDNYKEPTDAIQTRKLPDVPKIPVDCADYLSDTNTSTYALPDGYQISAMGSRLSYPHPNVPPPSYMSATGTNNLMIPQSLYNRRLYDSDDPTSRQCLLDSGSLTDSLPWPNDVQVMEFSPDHLRFIEKIGEGLFGEVHLCEALQINDVIGDDFLVNRMGSNSMLVAVKVLNKLSSEKAKEDFEKEVKIMARLRDPNIVCLLGVCTRDEPLCVVLEYMKFGDLNQFLQKQTLFDGTIPRNKTNNMISYGCLVYMATQVASGMKFLETLNIIHRDLATRNCLVGHQYTIKISDFGMSRNLYTSDYYRIQGKAVLPIRWMAWESILLGKFSTKSDVWSFGVTLWEILMFAREQPFDFLTDEQVIENCGHYFHSDGQELYLNQPPNSPKEIYDLMLECWNREESQRPSFKEIHMFLQRKNMGYNPVDENCLSKQSNIAQDTGYTVDAMKTN